MASKSVYTVTSVEALRAKGWSPVDRDGGVERLLDELSPGHVPAHKRPGNRKLRRLRKQHPGRYARRAGW